MGRVGVVDRRVCRLGDGTVSSAHRWCYTDAPFEGGVGFGERPPLRGRCGRMVLFAKQVYERNVTVAIDTN